MNKKQRLLAGCLIIAGLTIAAGYKHLGPALSGDPETRPNASHGSDTSGPANPLIATSLDAESEARELDPNRYENGWPVLVKAAYQGDLEEVQALIKLGADVNIKGPNDWTPLLQAAGNGHAEVIQALIDAGANIHAENKSWNNARDLAEERGYEEIAQSLYDRGVADDRVRDFIRLSIMGVETQIHNRMLDGHDPNRVDHKGRSALFYTLCNDRDKRYNQRQFVLRPNVIKRLLENGADPNLRDLKGKTPATAFITEYSPQPEVMGLLIRHGAKLDVIDKDNCSLLHHPRSKSIASVLIDLGLDVNQADKYGQTPLHHHARARNSATVALLLEKGADPEVTDKEGRKPIDLLLPERQPGSSRYEQWKATYDTLLRVSQPSQSPDAQ